MASKYGYMAKIGADTSGLTQALTDVENKMRNISAELKTVNEGLKLDDGNSAENLSKKYDLISQAIEQTKQKLDQLKSAEEAVNNAVKNGDMSTEQQKKYKREIENTESQLRRYEQELKNTQGQLDKTEKETSDVTEETRRLENAVEGAGKRAVDFGDIFKGNFLGNLAADGVRKLADSFVDFAKEGIELASDLTEVQNVVDVTFGNDADIINKWAKNAGTAFGMSELAAKQYTGTLGAMLKSQGITSDSVVELSENLVGLAGDMASFYNLDIETAFEKIRSGISGETEPLKQLGINMSVTNMEAYALAEGIEKPWRKMSQQEQTMLRYQYLLDQTADAQGDFVRTSDSYANQQRIMQLQMQNLSAELGEKLLPVAMEITQLISSSAPSIMNDIEGIGDAVVTVAKFLIEHRELITSLVAAYGTFKGAMAIGSVVSGAVNAYRTLTTATQAATVAQEANNVAVAANPYMLLISAVVAAGVAIGSYVMQLDSAIESEKEIKKAAEDTMKSSEAEARTIETKANRYKRLYEEYKNTGVATGEMIELAKELQELSPGTIHLIDEETGAYNELSDSIKDVIAQIRLKGIEQAKSNSLDSYYNNITEYYTQQAKAYQDYSKAVANISDETLAELEKGSEGAYKEFFENTTGEYGDFGINRNAAMEAAGLDWEAFQTYTDAIYQRGLVIDSTNAKIEENEKHIQETSESYDKLAETIGKVNSSETSSVNNSSYIADEERKKGLARAEEQKKANEEYAKQQEEFEKQLKEDWEKLDSDYNKRKIVDANGEQDEGAYYQKRRELLDKSLNQESEQWWKYYDEIAKYEAKKADEQQKANEKTAAENKKRTEEQQKEYEDGIKKQIDDVKLRGELGEITEEQMWNEIQIIVDGLDKESDLYSKYNAEILKGRKSLNDALVKSDEDAWKKSSKELTDEVTKQYKELEKTKEKAKSEFLNVKLSDTVTDKDGKDKEVLTNLDDEIKKMDKYNATLEKLKNKGASDSLIEKIQSMNYDDGSRQKFIDTLLGLSDSGLKLYFSDWDRLQEKANESAQNIIQDDLDALNEKATSAVSQIFGDQSLEAYEKGRETAESYLQGIIDSMGGMNDMSVISGLETAAGITRGSSTPKNFGGSGGLSLNTPITINLNDKQYINTTLGELIDKGARTGGNTFNM